MNRLSWLAGPSTTVDSQCGMRILLNNLEHRPQDPGASAFERQPENGWISRATWAFVGLGLLVRLVRYLVVYPIWHDEAFVAVNFLNRGYLDLLRPLDYYQACPVLFLWIELTAVRIFGFSELALRLFPAICGLASVVLFRHLAARLLRGIPLLLAVAVFAIAFYPIRHSAEVKPYASDLLASLALLTLAVEWLRRPDQGRWWWALSLATPPLLALSYPSVLVAAGLVIVLAPKVSRGRRRAVRLAFLNYAAVLAVSFVGLYFAFTVVQSNALRSAYRSGFWRESFPPWDAPAKIPGWLIRVHAGNTLAYPIGGERGASTLTLAAVLAGVVALRRRGHMTLLLLLLSPFATGLAAASLGQYPYGGAPRITQYLAPSICVLTGLGVAVLFERLLTTTLRLRASVLTAGLLAALGCCLAGRDLVRPYRVPGDLTSRSFARWVWTKYSPDIELLCVQSDLGFAFQPELWKRGMSAVYLFHQAACGHKDSIDRRPERLLTLTPVRPVRLVFFDEFPRGNPNLERWLSRIRSNYRIGEAREFMVSPGKLDEAWLRERYVVIDLEPRAIPSDVDRGAELVARPIETPAEARFGGRPAGIIQERPFSGNNWLAALFVNWSNRVSYWLGSSRSSSIWIPQRNRNPGLTPAASKLYPAFFPCIPFATCKS